MPKMDSCHDQFSARHLVQNWACHKTMKITRCNKAHTDRRWKSGEVADGVVWKFSVKSVGDPWGRQKQRHRNKSELLPPCCNEANRGQRDREGSERDSPNANWMKSFLCSRQFGSRSGDEEKRTIRRSMHTSATKRDDTFPSPPIVHLALGDFTSSARVENTKLLYGLIRPYTCCLLLCPFILRTASTAAIGNE